MQITVQSENDATETIAETSTEAEVVTKESLIAAATALAEKPAEEIGRDEVARLRQQFNAIRKEELDAEKAAFIEKGNEEAAFDSRESHRQLGDPTSPS